MKPYRVTQHIGGDGMEQLPLNFDGFPKNPFSEGTQNWRVFEYLRIHRSITTQELHIDLGCDTARLRSDIRPYLRKHGYDYTVRAMEGEGNNRLYKVTP